MNALLHIPWLPAVGWALLHSLWEGTVVVLLVALALRWLRGATPRMRYAVAVFGLILMAGLPIRHLVSLHPDPKPVVLARGTLNEDAQVSVQPIPTKAPLSKIAISSNLEKALPWVVAAWILGVCLSLILT